MEILNEKDWKLLEEFIDLNKTIPPQYSLNWKKTIEKIYKNCKSYYLIEKENEKIKSVFPFFIVKSRFFGNRIVSVPFFDFGGPNGKFDPNFLTQAIDHLKKEFKTNFKHIEIRLNTFNPDYKQIEEIFLNNGFQKESRRHQFILKLEDNEEKMLDKFNRITRKGIKKAQNSELKVTEIKTEDELKKFYDLYLKSMRNFGTPQHSYSYFKNLLIEGKDIFKGFNCYKDGKVIAFLIILASKGYFYAAYNNALPEYLKYQPNDILYWTAISLAIKNKTKYFDFGQVESNAPEGSRAQGIFRFKSKWVADLYERPYFYYPFKLDERQNTIGEQKNRFKKVISLWKKMPLSIIKVVGPKICSQMAL